MSVPGGKADLAVTSDDFRNDPTETWAAQDFRSAKALFVPSLKRDIVPSIAWTRPPTGGSGGNPHPTTRIHSRDQRRSGGVAARCARAAGSDAGDRFLSSHIAGS